MKDYHFIHNCGIKESNTFPKVIYPKVNVITRLEFKIAYFETNVV